MTLQSYLRILAERWKLIVLFVILGTGIAVLVTATTPEDLSGQRADVRRHLEPRTSTSTPT